MRLPNRLINKNVFLGSKSHPLNRTDLLIADYSDYYSKTVSNKCLNKVTQKDITDQSIAEHLLSNQAS